MKIIASSVLLACLVGPAPAAAWDNFGHMEVAALAWGNLTPAARTRAGALLKLNPMYQSWIKDVPSDKQDEIAFVMAATWPDAIKRSSDYHSDGADGGDRPPPGPAAAQNIGYADHFMHKYWHFIDMPFSPDHTALQDPVTPNAQTQIAAFRASLADPAASDDVKSYDLAWLLHLVGDVHQPLHATSRFTHSQTDGDAGGNKVKIRCGSGCSASELHAFWDDVLGTSNDPNAAIQAAADVDAADETLAAIKDENRWIQESVRAAKKYAYASPIAAGPGPYALTQKYKTRASQIAKQRVAMAGARLANLLNAALQ